MTFTTLSELDAEKKRALKDYFLNELPPYIKEKLDEMNVENVRKVADDLMIKYMKQSGYTEDQISRYNKNNTEGFCLSYSYLLGKVLRAYGFNVEVIGVAIMVGNEDARKLWYSFKLPNGVGSKSEYRTQQLANHFTKHGYGKAYTLGCGLDGMKHHVIVRIGDTILDATANQMSRPEHDIKMKPYWKHKKKLPRNIFFLRDLGEMEYGGTIESHPKIDEIYNEVSMGISRILEVPFKKMKG